MKKALFALMAIALMVLVACAAPKAEEPAPVSDQPVAEPTPAPEPTPVAPIVTPSGSQLNLLTDVVCVNGKISAIVTNTGDTTWDVASDVDIVLNGGIDEVPGCDKESIAPGESTLCDSIDWPKVSNPGKINAVVVVADGSRQTVKTVCPEPATGITAE